MRQQCMRQNSSAEVLYHGSNEELDELGGNEPGYGGSLGYGLYLTTDEDFARVFGGHVHEVVSPVPEELVAEIEPMVHDCGDSMQMYTPGSSPFTFEIVDRESGQTHRYSVLGNCEEEVKQSMRAQAIEKYRPSEPLRDEAKRVAERLPEIGEMAQVVVDAVRDGGHVGDAIDDELDSLGEDACTEETFRDARKLLLAAGAELETHVEQLVDRGLGEEIDLDDLSRTVEHHGYSAFFIEGYAPGNEYVIFDDAYLPVRVLRVH